MRKIYIKKKTTNKWKYKNRKKREINITYRNLYNYNLKITNKRNYKNKYIINTKTKRITKNNQ